MLIGNGILMDFSQRHMIYLQFFTYREFLLIKKIPLTEKLESTVKCILKQFSERTL